MRINEDYLDNNEETTLDLENIPSVCGLENPSLYDGVPNYSQYSYFGDCKNTVDADHIWDATQMSNFINTCKVIEPQFVTDKLIDGDRSIPKTARRIINALEQTHRLNETSEIVCALDDYQKIMFIYLSETDTHYFFDCVR